jgi:signal transduction histidine kinase
MKIVSIGRLIVIVLSLLLVPALLTAQERGTAAEAQALVARATALYDEAGRDAAFAAIEDPDGDFVDHDLYVFVYGPGRTIVAHGSNRALVGLVADTLIDVDGVPFGAMFMNEATESGTWVDYKWHDPVTREDLPKSSWVVRHDGYIFGSGIYKP